MGPQKAKAAEEERIIGTNDYSIVSKRSVEKLYLSDEPEFLRPFVSKFKRRAPLINRGYWLRMKAIEHVVKQFLEHPLGDARGKAVVNLGCGYDALPFRMRWKYPTLCQDVKFIDVDYPQLIEKKVHLLRAHNFYNTNAGGGDGHHPIRNKDSALFYAEGDEYSAIGCDLEDLDCLKDLFDEPIGNLTIGLFVAEVSATYMPTSAAEALLKWTRSFGNSRFCLLEQFLPDGPDHPFAKTMLDHFAKSAPLKSILRYPSLEAQKKRFLDAGWSRVRARNLWGIWQDPGFLTDEERRAINSVEPFDEWEELALFAGHYLLLVASTDDAVDVDRSIASSKQGSGSSSIPGWPSIPANLLYTDLPRGHGLRRFGAVCRLDHSTAAFHGGQTCSTRQKPADIYSRSTQSVVWTYPPESFTGHTITQTGPNKTLVVGGRTSPGRASSKCWISGNSSWTRVADLTPGRYRHCAVSIQSPDFEGALIFGGKTGTGEVLDEWSFWDGQDGWQRITPMCKRPKARFGANMVVTQACSGILLGGMCAAGTVLTDIWRWEIVKTNKLEIKCYEVQDLDLQDRLTVCRFGATLTRSRWGSLLVGGVGSCGVVQQGFEMMVITDELSISPPTVSGERTVPRPLLIGHGAIKIDDDNILVVGGAAVCFSFGSFWNGGYYLVSSDAVRMESKSWYYVTPNMDTARNEGGGEQPKTEFGHHDSLGFSHSSNQMSISKGGELNASKIRTTGMTTAEEFSQILESRAPVVITGSPLGPCSTLWTQEYLTEKIGSNRLVTIHKSSTPHLSFRSRNFTYETQPFQQFIQAAAAGEHVYLRAISLCQPSKLPANLDRDFPEIAADFIVPEPMSFAKTNMHSSVLRISGNVNMWLHYDVMANILCQIHGSKRVILFPPSDVSSLRFRPGETTSDLDVVSEHVDGLSDTHPVEIELKEGEVLFIPACWPHATAPAGDHGLSVAVNVFFRSLSEGYAVGRDVYGNRDLAAYEEGRRDLLKVTPSLEQLGKEERKTVLPVLTAMLRGERVENEVTVEKVLSRELAKIRNRLRTLPLDLEQFYSQRLVDELKRLLQDAD